MQIFHMLIVCKLTFSSHKECGKYGETWRIWRKEHETYIAPRLCKISVSIYLRTMALTAINEQINLAP